MVSVRLAAETAYAVPSAPIVSTASAPTVSVGLAEPERSERSPMPVVGSTEVSQTFPVFCSATPIVLPPITTRLSLTVTASSSRPSASLVFTGVIVRASRSTEATAMPFCTTSSPLRSDLEPVSLAAQTTPSS